MNDWDVVRKEFNPQSTLIFGANGKGKTSFCAQYLVGCMTDRAYWREVLRECYRRTAEWNDGGFHLSLDGNPRHLAYTNVEGGVVKGAYRTHDIDISRFGLRCEANPNPFLLPYGSVVFIDEGQRYFNSRGGGIPDHVSIISEIKRHNGLTLLVACQRARLIDLNYRALFHKFIEVDGMTQRYDQLRRLVRTTWHCWEFDDPFALESFLNGGKDRQAAGGKRTQYVYEGNIFETYDPESCEGAFFDGAENENYEIVPSREKERTSAATNGFGHKRFGMTPKTEKKRKVAV